MIILGIGTNIEDRINYLQTAIHHLNKTGLEVTAISNIYESPALLKPDAPKEWDTPYLNIAVLVKTNIEAQDLLKKVKEIEQKIGRINRGIWAPREIDIDILAYGSLQINEPDLIIPHACLCERDFAILPFADIAPDWHYPGNGIYKGKTAKELANAIKKQIAKKTNYKLTIQ